MVIESVNERNHIWTDGRMDGRMNGQTNGQTEWKKTINPFGILRTPSLRKNFWSATGRLSVRQKFSPGQRENLQYRQILVSTDNNLGLENIILVFRWYCFSAFYPKTWRQKQMKFKKKMNKISIIKIWRLIWRLPHNQGEGHQIQALLVRKWQRHCWCWSVCGRRLNRGSFWIAESLRKNHL